MRTSYSDATVAPNIRKKEGEYQGEERIPGVGEISWVKGGKREYQGEKNSWRNGNVRRKRGISGRGKNT